MTEKILNTRIQLKYDTWDNWQKTDVANKGGNLVLKQGEMAVTAIASGKSDFTTPPTIMFKVGDGASKFSELPWASGLAADVYPWAKSPTAPVIGNGKITIKQGTAEKGSFTVNQSGDTTITLDADTDTDTQYQLVLNDHTLKLQSKAKNGTWADVSGQSFTLPDNNTTYSFTEGTTNGAFTVTPSDGTAQSVKVHGLGTAAYKADTYFATQAAYSATASQVATNTQDISDLKETVTGGMHFKGKFDILPAVTSYSAGDFVIVGTKEYILYVDGSSKKSWVELGDEGSHLTKVQADGYYVTKNSDITAGTHTKITYDTKGLVTKGEDLTATDIPNLPASKITSGTFSDDRIASASVWNAKQNALTAEQLAAANSGITAEKVTKYDGYADTLAGKQETLTPTQLEAVNSGITSTKVTTYDGYASKISTLESKPGLDKTGTVTSVGVSTTANGGLKVTGSPITSSGTINIDIDDAVTFVFDCGSSSTNI